MDADVTTTVETTVVSGSFYSFSSVVMASAVAADARMDVVHGTTAAEITVAANPYDKGTGGIFGCPSCLGASPSLIETLKLFLPYFPLHIQKLISMYLQLLDFIHIFEMVQNMMNHLDEYQALFQMFETMGNASGFSKETSGAVHAPSAFTSLFGGNSVMPDFSSIQKMMEGSDLVDEFTYVEEPSGSSGNGS